jgi:2'-5' RNA ligase
MLRRIFAALTVSERLGSEIEKWRARYRELPVRWLAGKNLHITLVPPWYEEDVEAAIAKLESAGHGMSSFEIEFRRVEFGPDPRRPRLIWAEGKTPPELVSLKSAAEKALGKKPEERPFRLHLTLARFRSETFSSFRIKRLEDEVLWRDRADSFVLMESHLSPQGADYAILKSYKLL